MISEKSSSTTVHLLTAYLCAKNVFFSRYLLDFLRPNNYRLRVREVRLEDRGYYHCQLATHPPQILWTLLQIASPVIRYYHCQLATHPPQVVSPIIRYCKVQSWPKTLRSVALRNSVFNNSPCSVECECTCTASVASELLKLAIYQSVRVADPIYGIR
jgi:hypothetical protein